MELNKIKCKNYSAGEIFRAILFDTTEDEIKNISPEELRITIEDNELVESFVTYGRLFSIKHNFNDDTFEVEFEKISPLEKMTNESIKLCDKLQAKIDELEEKNKIILGDVEKLSEQNKMIVDQLASFKDVDISSIIKDKEE